MGKGRGTVVLFFMIIVLGLSACSSGNSSKSKDGEKGVDAVVNNEPVELTFWFHVGSIADNEGFMNVFGNKIKEKFPYVMPKFIAPGTGISLKSLIDAGQPIDIFYDAFAQAHQNLLQYGMQYDLTSLIKKYNYDLAPLEKTSVEAQRHIAGGGMYGLPVSIDSITMLYNKGIFDKFAVPHPKDGMTMDDLYELTRKVSRVVDGTKYYGLGMSPAHVTVADPLSPVFIDTTTNKSNFSSDKFKQMFQTLTRFYTIPNNEVDESTWTYAAQLKLFGDQRLAILLGPSALGTRYFADKDKTLDWDLATYPTYKEAPSVGPQYAPGYFYVPVNSKHKEVAFQVAAYVTSLEMQQHIARKGYTTARQDSAVISEYGKDLPFMKDKNVKALFTGKVASIAPLTKYQSIAVAEIAPAFKDVMLNVKDVNTALREADERINIKITQEMAK